MHSTKFSIKLKKAIMVAAATAMSLTFLVPATTTQAQASTKTHRAKIVWNYLRNHHYSKRATAGILGNLDQESGISATAGGSYFGLMQWGGSRKSNLYSFASTKGLNANTVKTQVKFMHKKDCYNLKTNMKAHDNTIAQATKYFEYTYERAGNPVMSNRIKKAKYWYYKLGGLKSLDAVVTKSDLVATLG